MTSHAAKCDGPPRERRKILGWVLILISIGGVTGAIRSARGAPLVIELVIAVLVGIGGLVLVIREPPTRGIGGIKL